MCDLTDDDRIFDDSLFDPFRLQYGAYIKALTHAPHWRSTARITHVRRCMRGDGHCDIEAEIARFDVGAEEVLAQLKAHFLKIHAEVMSAVEFHDALSERCGGRKGMAKGSAAQYMRNLAEFVRSALYRFDLSSFNVGHAWERWQLSHPYVRMLPPLPEYI
jgi:hypothetical protein